jgi:hypothetical protein
MKTLRSLGRNDPFAFSHGVEAISFQVVESILFTIGPLHLYFVDSNVTPQPEMNAKIVLRQVATTAQDFSGLNQIASSGFDACIERQSIAFRAF